MSDVTSRSQAGASHHQAGADPSGTGDGGTGPGADARGRGSAGQGAKRYQKRLYVALVAAVVAFAIDLSLAHATSATVLKVLVSVATVAGFVLVCVATRSFIASGRAVRADMAGLSRDSVLVSSRAASLKVFQREMAARYGDQVGALSEQVGQAFFRMTMFNVVLLLYTFAYLNLYTHISYLGGLLYFVIAVPLAGAVLWYGLAVRRTNRLVTESLDALVRSGVRPPGPLPRTPAEYIAWCEASGIPPYPYGRPVWDAEG